MKINLSAYFEPAFENAVNMILLKWEEIRKRIGDSFTEEMVKVAEQPYWKDGRHRTIDGGNDGQGWSYLPKATEFAGGLEGYVFSNMFFRLQLSTNPGYQGSSILVARMSMLTLKMAMDQNSDLDLFVRTVVAGTKKVGMNFGREIFEDEALRAFEVLTK